MTRTVQQLFDLTGKTALVTGGSRGLGLQLAQSLGEAGAKVLLSSRKAADLEESVAVLKKAGIDAQFIAADCADDRQGDIGTVGKLALNQLTFELHPDHQKKQHHYYINFQKHLK